jgi:hypothetical protein
MGKKALIIITVIVAGIGLGVWKLTGALSRGGKLGDAAVAQFHAQWNAGKEDDIVRDSHPRFKESVSLEKFRGLTGHLRSKLGSFQSSERTGISLNTNNGDTTLNMKYAAKFEKGDATESFVFDYNGEQPLLLHFNIESPLLIEPTP